MKYALAILCPPYALWDCGKPWQGVLGLLLLMVAISGGNVGIVLGTLFLEILWAWATVGERDAYREAQQFVRSVQSHDAARRFWIQSAMVSPITESRRDQEGSASSRNFSSTDP